MTEQEENNFEEDKKYYELYTGTYDAFKASKSKEDKLYWQGVKDGLRKAQSIFRPGEKTVNDLLLRTSYTGGKLTPTEVRLERAEDLLYEIDGLLIGVKSNIGNRIKDFLYEPEADRIEEENKKFND